MDNLVSTLASLRKLQRIYANDRSLALSRHKYTQALRVHTRVHNKS